MAISVEHDKRRKKILENALAVFVEDGFEEATYQKIADRCGITRTILYLYFKNKREIFSYSIKQLLLSVEEKINEIRADVSINSIEKIKNLYTVIFKLLEQNQQLLSVVLDYLLYLSKSAISPEERVRKRTGKLRHVLLAIIKDGIKKGELKKTSLTAAGNYLYSFIDAGIYQLVVLKRSALDEIKETAFYAVNQLSVIPSSGKNEASP